MSFILASPVTLKKVNFCAASGFGSVPVGALKGLQQVLFSPWFLSGISFTHTLFQRELSVTAPTADTSSKARKGKCSVTPLGHCHELRCLPNPKGLFYEHVTVFNPLLYAQQREHFTLCDSLINRDLVQLKPAKKNLKLQVCMRFPLFEDSEYFHCTSTYFFNAKCILI